MRRVSYAAETDLDQLADVALNLAYKVRDESPVIVRNQLQALCQQQPVMAAQLMMCLAIWFDPNTTTDVLFARVDAVANTPLGGAA